MNRRESIYAKIKDDIISGDFKPGERLLELKLTGIYGVSRTPVREALRQLESDGLLVVVPHKGATVSKLSIQEYGEIIDIRAILETSAVRLARPKIKKAHLDEMVKIQEKLKNICAKKDYAMFTKYNKEFHFLFPRISGNKNLLRIIQDLRKRLDRYEFITVPLNLDLWLEGHQKVVDAVMRNDWELAARNMERHLQDIRKIAINFLKSFPQAL